MIEVAHAETPQEVRLVQSQRRGILGREYSAHPKIASKEHGGRDRWRGCRQPYRRHRWASTDPGTLHLQRAARISPPVGLADVSRPEAIYPQLGNCRALARLLN